MTQADRPMRSPTPPVPDPESAPSDHLTLPPDEAATHAPTLPATDLPTIDLLDVDPLDRPDCC